MSAFDISIRPASASHDLLLVERAEPLALKLRDFLQRKQFTIKTAVTPPDAAELATELIRPILLIDCGSRPGAREYVWLYRGQANLKQLPVIVLGADVDGLADELYGEFPLVATLRTPCAPSELLDSINYISERYPSLKPAPSQPPLRDSAPSAPTTSRASEQDDDEPPTAFPAYAQFDSIATLYFDQAREAALLEMNLGGAQYARLGVNGLKEHRTWSGEGEKCQSLITEILRRSGKWGKGHISRVGLVADNILHALSLPEKMALESRHAARLLNMAIVTRSQNYLRKEFTGRGSLLIRKELCSWLKDSALQLATVHKEPGISEIVATVGRMIGREEPLSDEPRVLAASAILAAEILDRTCFQTGHWNPRAAHRLLRKIAGRKFRDLHPGALCALAKILTEALATSSPSHMIGKAVREDPILIERAKQNREQIVAIHETKVALDQLTPGMRLSQPLFAFDGKQLLEENLTLDQDLIWRIWQLSALRPINTPIVVLRAAQQPTADTTPFDDSAESPSSLSD
jgi:hypothetical protein